MGRGAAGAPATVRKIVNVLSGALRFAVEDESLPSNPAHELVPPPPPISDPDADGTPEPFPYDTGLSAEEGLWSRSGWAGRS